MNPVDITFEELLAAASSFSHACLLHSNQAPGRRYDWLVALGARRILTLPAGDALSGIQAFWAAVAESAGAGTAAADSSAGAGAVASAGAAVVASAGAGEAAVTSAAADSSAGADGDKAGCGWLFGYLSYDLKNETCQPELAVGHLESSGLDRIGFPDICWFEPEYLWVCEKGRVRQIAGGPWLELVDRKVAGAAPNDLRNTTPILEFDFDYPQYAQAVEAIRQHIREGDVYEVNLCPTFFSRQLILDPVEAFERLNTRTQAPFAGYLRVEERHLICASPERFLARQGSRIWSQPIKGTAARGRTAEEDERLAAGLEASEKDRAENIMIVDLVRNDLAKCCEPGSVQVPEFVKRHTFPTLHHLISTVEGTLRQGLDFSDAWRAAFPMGSMTGAPKIMALELIEQYEHSRRGLYSGALGYVDPGGDFDLNVVIRSLLYNATARTAAWPAGGAITWDSNPEQEWNEVQVKAEAIQRMLIEPTPT